MVKIFFDNVKVDSLFPIDIGNSLIIDGEWSELM